MDTNLYLLKDSSVQNLLFCLQIVPGICLLHIWSTPEIKRMKIVSQHKSTTSGKW